MHEELDKFCPSCPPIFHHKNPEKQIGVRLNLYCDNYSGCGVDFCRCPECNNSFQVSYKVDKITPLDR
jgi:hypothetical protein